MRRSSRTVIAGVSVALVAGMIIIPVGLMYHRLHPDRRMLDDDPGRHGLSYESIAFASLIDAAPLRGWYLPSPAPTHRAIVIAPGIDNDRLVSGITLRLAPGLLEAGFDVLAFDLRGEGESGGEPITFGDRERWDVLAAVEEVRARGATRVGVLAYSLGAASTILAAAQSPAIDAVAVDSSFADLTETLSRGMEAMRLPAPAIAYGLALYRVLSGTDPADVAPVEAVAAIPPRPLLIIHGTADETVPVSDSERLLAAAGSSADRWLVKGGHHAMSYFVDEAAYLDRVAGFFARAMPT